MLIPLLVGIVGMFYVGYKRDPEGFFKAIIGESQGIAASFFFGLFGFCFEQFNGEMKEVIPPGRGRAEK